MTEIYFLGAFFGFMFGCSVGFYIGASYIERLVKRERDKRNEALTRTFDWQE